MSSLQPRSWSTRAPNPSPHPDPRSFHLHRPSGGKLSGGKHSGRLARHGCRSHAGEQAWPEFDKFYREQFGRVAGAMLLVLGDREEAFDVTQESFAR